MLVSVAKEGEGDADADEQPVVGTDADED